jgi:hypothetical protein
MSDSRAIRKISGLAVAVGITWLTASCGGNGAANNDQGMSVTFLGLFNSNRLEVNNAGGGGGGGGGNQTPGNQGCGQLPAGFSGGYIRLGEAEPEPGGTASSTNLSGTDPAGGYVSVVGVQNNLYGQAFRAERLLVDFYIPGASIQPPSTNVPVFLIAGPAESAAQVNNNGGGGAAGGTGNGNGAANPGLRRPLFTSLPPSFSNLCNRSLAQVTIIPPAIREWLNFNRDVLPEPPFKMEVTIRLNGLSSSGNRYDTNDGTFDFDILPESFIEPTTGDGSETPAATPTSATPDSGTGTGDGSEFGDLEKIF